MANSLNRVMLIGNLGKEPEIRMMQDGKEVASFSIATSESWKDKMSGEKREKTEWHRIVIFAQPLVSITKSYLKKGSKVYIEGALQTRKWVDTSGIEKYSTEIVLQPYDAKLIILDKLDSNQNFGGSTNTQVTKSESFEQDYTIADDEIPF